MLQVKTYLDKDNYGGQGLFAGEDIAKGVVIWKVDPEDVLSSEKLKRWRLEEFLALPTTELEKVKKYVYPDYEIIDGEITDFIALNLDNSAFFNHSDNPNVITHHKWFSNAEHLNLDYAAWDIKKGEELTYDYFTFHPELERFKDIAFSINFLFKSE